MGVLGCLLYPIEMMIPEVTVCMMYYTDLLASGLPHERPNIHRYSTRIPRKLFVWPSPGFGYELSQHVEVLTCTTYDVDNQRRHTRRPSTICFETIEPPSPPTSKTDIVRRLLQSESITSPAMKISIAVASLCLAGTTLAFIPRSPKTTSRFVELTFGRRFIGC